ncbi:hypothetical protein Poly30_29290 [Planctomycetes bacterium Poly30]|uniref:Cytochrome c-552/4 domain-containing protein n=1 Tax=Saltatorellus ferox TaxID=2528018 RepID=A0A518ETK1_9BACT|nr:hypothetical protein Poly30_29290 [Planctomycetes bacterium Poly30]
MALFSFHGRSAAAFAALPVASMLAAAVAAPPAPVMQTQVQATLDDFFVPGTQPLGLNVPIYESSNCAACHGFYDPVTAPYDQWATSMMGQAGRDPIFYATLAIANQDVAFGGEACLRCHAPGAWLDGRSQPSDGSALDPNLGDLDGVTCHFCHRMVDPIGDIANPAEDVSILASLAVPALEAPHSGSFVIDPDDNRRGPFQLDPNFFYHEWRESPFHQESLMCATCHDVSNPLLELQPDGSWQVGPLGTAHPTGEKQDQFPVERTFSEWAMSVYAQAPIETGGRFGGDKPAVSSCQDCHMPDAAGTGANPAFNPIQRPDVPQHGFAGANSWVLKAIRAQYPDNETGLSQAGIDEAIARNEAMLAAAADLEAVVLAGQLKVRITNMMGHKLPTGYGEGRRMWIDARFFDAQDNLLETRGGYDLVTADLDKASTTVYEIEHGLDAQMAAATGLPQGKSLHFLLNNTIEKDNRIPARGFTNPGYDAIGAPVVGALYADAQYWSEVDFALPTGAVRAEMRLFHQTSSKEYIEFLQAENTTNTTGQEAYQLWDMFGRSKPVEMALTQVDLAQNVGLMPRPLALGKVTSAGDRPELNFNGSTLAGSAAGGQLEITGGIPGALVVVFRSPTQISQDYLGGTLNIGAGARRIATLTLDGSGAANVVVNYGAGDAGQGYVYQALFRDVASSGGLGMTGGLRVDVTQ